MGIGDWGLGLGIGDWAQSPIPNPQSPIPNPHNKNKYYNNSNNFIYKKLINIFNVGKNCANIINNFDLF